jgi:hypothetical protein
MFYAINLRVLALLKYIFVRETLIHFIKNSFKFDWVEIKDTVSNQSLKQHSYKRRLLKCLRSNA